MVHRRLAKTPLDGELWFGHGQFSRAVSCVRKKIPDETSGARCTSWYSICQRIQVTTPNAMPHYSLSSRKIGQPWVHHVEQFKCSRSSRIESNA